MDDEKLNSPDVADFLHAAVDTMYGDGQEPEVYSQLSNATPADILDYLESQGYTEDEIVDAMNDYYSDTEEVDNTPEKEFGIISSSTSESKDTDGDGEIDRTEVDSDGDGEVDMVHVEADSPKELKEALNDTHAASTPEEEEMYKTIFKKNAKDTNRKFKPETPEEKEMEDMFKPSNGMLDILKNSF